jgi:hypothetical protein
MSNFDVETDIDIDIEEFVDACNKREIDELIDYLVECEYLPPTMLSEVISSKTFSEKDFEEKLSKIANNRFLLSDEELELIEKIANRF